jgi:uncharacterized protein (TIGR03790 family)
MPDAVRVQHRAIFARTALAVLVLLGCCGRAMALVPDEIALIINSNVPVGRDLAQFYAQARHIPDNRILELSLPTTDDISFDEYERTVVPQVREFLRTGDLDNKVKCFVTFYGVPLRIAARLNTPGENTERQALIQETLKAAGLVPETVKGLEKLAVELDPTFQPIGGEELEQLYERTNLAIKDINSQLGTIPDLKRRTEITEQIYTTAEPLIGDYAKVQRLGYEAALNATTQPGPPRVPADFAAARDDYNTNLHAAAKMEQDRFDPKARGQLRQMMHDHFGLFSYLKAMRDQIDYLTMPDTGAAFDSELALSDWIVYSHIRWWENPRYYAVRKRPTPPTFMVMRLDAPKPEMVKQIITDSLAVEAAGLKGQIVIDGRGLPPTTTNPTERGFSEFDQYFRDLADLLRAHSKIQIMQDDKPEVLPANSAKDVALYCGWYSLHNYIPCCKFNPGAIGYHVASYEMLSLHNGDSGWAPGLLNSGVAATLGPVAEPYIAAFPRPDNFFPLLLTGKLPLAEVFWDTEPMTSWMVCMVGDPLYTPYKNNPQLQVSDLPDRLKSIFDVPATQPAVP